MRKIVGILVCLLLSLQLYAVGYQPVTYSAPVTTFRSTSAYNGSIQPTGSLSAISAANYNALNSEGGACYSPSGPRKGRPTGGSGSSDGLIGNYDFHSPVGDVPFLVMTVIAVLYTIFAKKHKKVQKNLAI